MGKLSTHVLDTMHGKPAVGVQLDLYTGQGAARVLVKQTRTSTGGRCDEPLLQGSELKPGRCALAFHVGAYFDSTAVALHGPAFLAQVPATAGVHDAG